MSENWKKSQKDAWLADTVKKKAVKTKIGACGCRSFAYKHKETGLLVVETDHCNAHIPVEGEPPHVLLKWKKVLKKRPKSKIPFVDDEVEEV